MLSGLLSNVNFDWISPSSEKFINAFYINNEAPYLSGSQAILPEVEPGGSFVISPRL